jgi:ubiquinone/menaquinone biosynthesis C-methylase UbiE
MPSSSDASPFTGTAPYYRFRAPYAPAALDFIVESLGLDPYNRALDLGCGPGTLAIPLSRAAREVVAIDPDAEMLAEGRRAAAVAGCPNIRWQQSAAEAMPLDAGPFQVATIGQAFHWMDRDEVLRRLAVLISAGGGLALVNPGKRRPQESWEPLAEEIVTKFLGPRTRHPGANPQEPKHEPALLRSEYFSEFTASEFPITFTRNVESIVGYVYSLSSSTRAAFGDAADIFETELSRALLELNPSGVFTETVETEVVLARKRRR